MKEMALKARNWPIYTRLNAAFDNTASDVCYHKSCYTKLFNEARSASSVAEKKDKDEGLTYDPLVIAELVAYIKYNRCTVRLVDLKQLYHKRLVEKKLEWIEISLNSTRFKEHLLQKLGDEWQSFQQSKFVILSPKSSTGEVLMDHLKKDLSEEEAKMIIEVSLLLRKYVLQSQPTFSGYFSENCLLEPVPSPLLTMIRVLLEVALTLSQLIISNSVVRGRKDTENLYQVQERETPVPLYFGLKLDSNGRQKKVIKRVHRYGICVSYGRLKNVRKRLAMAVSKRFQDDKVVVPSNCQKGVFTTGTTDNIDVSGREDMHGTSITMIGHISHVNGGEKPLQLDFNVDDDTPVVLPDEFADVPFVEDFGGDLRLKPIPEGDGRPAKTENLVVEEDYWLCHVRGSRVKDDNGKWKLNELPMTFSGYFSKKQNTEEVNPPAVIGTFPVFTEEKADSLSMQKHAMVVVQKATEFLNSRQTPVIEGDCPLYARQKTCQWLFPAEVGEDKIVCMMGFLHLEMCAQEAGGKLLGGSGWERMFVLSKIHKTGVAVSLLGGHKVKKTRQAYLVTLSWLEVLRFQGY